MISFQRFEPIGDRQYSHASPQTLSCYLFVECARSIRDINVALISASKQRIVLLRYQKMERSKYERYPKMDGCSYCVICGAPIGEYIEPDNPRDGDNLPPQKDVTLPQWLHEKILLQHHCPIRVFHVRIHQVRT